MKRYVMLENKEIVDTKIKDYPDYYCIRDGMLTVSEGYYNNLDEEYYGFTEVLNQSDNLLDLLEVGDCVEAPEFDYTNKRVIYEICLICDGYLYDEWGNELNSYITAIWKHNSNIMRRYEV